MRIEQTPEPELEKKVGASYAWEVRPEFLFCVWHAVMIFLGQGPCYRLANLHCLNSDGFITSALHERGHQDQF